MGKQDIFDEITAERKRQDLQWGGEKHDDQHSTRDWVCYIINFLARAVNKEAAWGGNLRIARIAFIKVSALCVAAIESIDRKFPLMGVIEAKVKSIIAEQLSVNLETVIPTASLVENLLADDLDRVELIMALEEEFGFEIPDEDAEKLLTVGDVIKYIEEKKHR